MIEKGTRVSVVERDNDGTNVGIRFGTVKEVLNDHFVVFVDDSNLRQFFVRNYPNESPDVTEL